MLPLASVSLGWRRDLTLIDASPSGERVSVVPEGCRSVLSGAPIARIAPRYDPRHLPVQVDVAADDGGEDDGLARGVPLMMRLQIVDAALAPVPDVFVRLDLFAPAGDGPRSTQAFAITSAAGVAEIETVFPVPRGGRPPELRFEAVLDDEVVRGIIVLPSELGDFLCEHVAPYAPRTDEFGALAGWQPAYLAQAVISADRSAPAFLAPREPTLSPEVRRRLDRPTAARLFSLVLAVVGMATQLFTPAARACDTERSVSYASQREEGCGSGQTPATDQKNGKG